MAAVACVERGPSQDRQIDPAYIEANIVGAIPDDLDHRIDADLGGVVTYVGNEVASESVERGGELRVVHYWKVEDAPGESWRVFAHAVGASADDWVNVDASDMRIGYPPAKWKAGDIIRDEQVFAVPSDWKSDHVDLRVGLYRRGGQSAGARMDIRSGPSDDEARVRAARIPLAGAPAKDAEPYAILRASGPIEIDGRGDDEAWERAPQSSAFSRAQGGRPMDGEARARLLWDDEFLYALIEVDDGSIYSEYTEDGDPLWSQDVVELFIDADRSGRGYVELQVNPRGAIYDSYFATTRAGGGDPDWESGMRAAVHVRGDPASPESEDEGWTAELAIPLEAVKGRDDGMDVAIPPRVGDRWNLNVVRVNGLDGDSVTASSWSPISISDFHALDRMLPVVFADEDGATAPSVEAVAFEDEKDDPAEVEPESGDADL